MGRRAACRRVSGRRVCCRTAERVRRHRSGGYALRYHQPQPGQGPQRVDFPQSHPRQPRLSAEFRHRSQRHADGNEYHVVRPAIVPVRPAQSGRCAAVHARARRDLRQHHRVEHHGHRFELQCVDPGNERLLRGLPEADRFASARLLYSSGVFIRIAVLAVHRRRRDHLSWARARSKAHVRHALQPAG